MTLSKPSKIILGVLTLWPIIYPVLFIIFVIGTMLSSMPGMMRHDPDASAFPAGFIILFVFHLLTILSIFALLAIYFYYLYNTERVPADKKALWAVVLFLGSALAMAVFFCIYIWPEDWPAPSKNELGIRE